jgi:hypothetical protein
MAVTVVRSQPLNGGTSTAHTWSIDITGGDTILILDGGFAGANRAISSVTIDGNTVTGTNIVESDDGARNAGAYIFYNTDSNWPVSDGTYSVVCNWSNSLQERGACLLLSGVDISGTPVAGSGTDVAAGTTASITVGSDTIDQAYDASVSKACVAASINASTGNGLQFMYCNTYSAADSGAGTGDTIQEFARNSTASSSYVALYRTLTVGGGANPKGPLNNPFMGVFGGPI